MKMYSTNLTDNQWQVIKKIINAQESKKGRGNIPSAG